MGLFSWNCMVCKHPMLHNMGVVTPGVNEWMNRVVVLEKNGSILRGPYDGYGRVGMTEMKMEWKDHKMINGPECYHEACYKAVGSPTEYTRASLHSIDQGHFFSDGAHDLKEKDIPDAIKKIKRPFKTWKIKKRAA